MSFRELRENIYATHSLLSDAVRHQEVASPPTETVTPSSQHGSSVLSRTPAAGQRQQGSAALHNVAMVNLAVKRESRAAVASQRSREGWSFGRNPRGFGHAHTHLVDI